MNSLSLSHPSLSHFLLYCTSGCMFQRKPRKKKTNTKSCSEFGVSHIIWGSLFGHHLITYIKAFKFMQMGLLDSMQSLERDNNSTEWQDFHPRHILRYPELFSDISTFFMLFISIFCWFVGLGGICFLHKDPWLHSSAPSPLGHKPSSAPQLKAAVKAAQGLFPLLQATKLLTTICQ